MMLLIFKIITNNSFQNTTKKKTIVSEVLRCLSVVNDSTNDKEIIFGQQEMARDKRKKDGSSKRSFSKKSMLGKCTSPRTTSPEESDNSGDTASYKTRKEQSKSEKARGFSMKKSSKQNKKIMEMNKHVESECKKPSLGCKDETDLLLPGKTVYENCTTQPKGGTKKRPDQELYKPPKARAMNPRRDMRENESRTVDIPVTDLNMFTEEKPVENSPYKNHRYKPAYRDVNINEESLSMDEDIHHDILPEYENVEHGRTEAIKMRTGSVKNLEAATKNDLVSDYSTNFNRSASVEYYGKTKDENTSLDGNMRQDRPLDSLKSNKKVYQPNTFKFEPQNLEKDKLVIEKAHSSLMKHQHQQRLEKTNLNRVFNSSSVKKPKSVGPAIFITEYATSEWKGKTVMADKIRRVCSMFLDYILL